MTIEECVANKAFLTRDAKVYSVTGMAIFDAARFENGESLWSNSDGFVARIKASLPSISERVPEGAMITNCPYCNGKGRRKFVTTAGLYDEACFACLGTGVANDKQLAIIARVRRLVQEAVTVREHALAYHEAEADKADGWRP